MAVGAPSLAGTPCTIVHVSAPSGGLVDDWVFEVIVGDWVVPRDASHLDGWDYTDYSYQTITIYGPSCDALANGSVTEAQLVFECLVG